MTDIKGPWTNVKGGLILTNTETVIQVVTLNNESRENVTNLITAAPELLDALKISLELIQDGYLDFDKLGFKNDKDIEIFIQNVIAKAERK